GLGHFRRLLLGSTTAKVLHDLDCPVWTSVHAEEAPELEDIACRKILCAVALDDQNNCPLAWAAHLAGEYQAELGIVHAAPAVVTSAPGRFFNQEFSASLCADARKRIEDILAKRDIKATVLVGAGEPAGVVSDVARNFGADLLVIGRHAKAGLAGHL